MSGLVRYLDSNSRVGHGVPVADADVVATAQGRAALFMFDCGAQLISGPAPATRIFFPGGYSTPPYHNLDGLTLLTAAVNAALS